jgi:NAD(P)-dependent dehydrogenase (short-subunit alcohol dehydrogenase family)
MRLSGKVALVTGAAKGIGEGISRAFVNEGAFVFLTDIDDAAGEALVAALGPQATYLNLDVADPSCWQDAIGRVQQQYGRLDILVNNAGITGFGFGPGPHDPENVSLEEWRLVHRINLDGTFLGCKYAIKAMKPNKSGSIINISSRSGLVGIPGAAAYASSKAAIRNHTKSVALYCAQHGWNIRCNSIHPAAIMTPLWDDMLGTGPDREKRIKAFVKDCPMQRFGTPEEVAAIAVLLASDEAPYITGSEFNIDGGILAGSAGAPTTE